MGREILRLPEPRLSGDRSLEECLAARRSVRSFSARGIHLEDVSQLLWSAQGRTGSGGERTAPSAGALYPLETFLAAGQISALEPGVYRYRTGEHSLAPTVNHDVRSRLSEASSGQAAVLESALTVVLAAVESRIVWKYGQRGIRYTCFEAGHAAQNICLQAVSLGLGTVVVGAFDDQKVHEILRLRPEEEPLYLICVGVPA